MFALEQNNPQMLRMRSAGSGRYPNIHLVNPDMFEMDDEGLGELGLSLKKAVKKVSKTVKKVTKPVSTVVNAPTKLVADKIISPVLDKVEKIPVVGSAVNTARSVAGKVLDPVGNIVKEIPIFGDTMQLVMNSVTPTTNFTMDTMKKQNDLMKASLANTKASGGGGGTIVEVIESPDSALFQDRTIEVPDMSTQPDQLQPQIPNIPGIDYSQSYLQNPGGGYLDPAYFLEEDERNIAPAGYEDYYNQTQTPNAPWQTQDILLYGGLALGGVVILTLLFRDNK